MVPLLRKKEQEETEENIDQEEEYKTKKGEVYVNGEYVGFFP